jgi:hypothetical protein
MFKKIHDIYALGVVLLEIGLWYPAVKVEKNMFLKADNPRAVQGLQAQLIKYAQKRLEPTCWNLEWKYKEVVFEVSHGKFWCRGQYKT